MCISYVQASKGGNTTGIPLFMACNVIKDGKHSVSTELETVLYVVIFILSNSVVSWRHIPADDHLAFATRVGIMTAAFKDKVLDKVPPNWSHGWLRRLRGNLFFSKKEGEPNYNPSVTCAQFLEACYLE